jgi:hypothetical protein
MYTVDWAARASGRLSTLRNESSGSAGTCREVNGVRECVERPGWPLRFDARRTMGGTMKSSQNSVQTPKPMRFQHSGREYQRCELTSYHTIDPKVSTVFQSLRDGAVFLKINGDIKPVADRELPNIAQRYRVPEILRMARSAA